MAGDHPRNTEGLRAARRCGARTRQGGTCRAPVVRGRARCRMHGGARGSGAPLGNQNALKHGCYTRETRAELRRLRELVREVKGELSRFGKR